MNVPQNCISISARATIVKSFQDFELEQATLRSRLQLSKRPFRRDYVFRPDARHLGFG